jgi:tight adherence protein B
VTAWLPAVLAASAAAVAAAPRSDGGRRLAAVAAAPRPAAPAPALIAAALVAAAAVLVGPQAALLGVVGLAVVRRSARSRRAAAVHLQEQTRALDAMAMLAADLRAGRSAADAFRAAAPIAAGPSSAALMAASAAADLGGDVASALSSEGSAVAPTLRALGACWQVCSPAGSGLADAVERLEEGLRAAEALRLSVDAELAGPRATAQLLAVLPLVGIALAAGQGAHPVDVLLGTPVGLGCLVVGLALDLLGVLWTRRLTERVLG